MKLKRNLALLSLGLLMATANAAEQYVGTWAVSDGHSGNVTMNVVGATFAGTMTSFWPEPMPNVVQPATMSGSFTGHRYKMVVTFNNGAKNVFQGNIKFDGNHIRMDGLRYFGNLPDVRTRLRMDVDWVSR